MTQYGDTQEPGVITDLTSSAAVPTSGESEKYPGYVGQADLANASNAADTSTVYQVTNASTAIERFGPKSSSMLTNAVIDALNEGAYPVYAVATAETSVTTEDHSGASSTTVDFDNAPIREDANSITVNLDSTDQTVNVVYDDVSTYSPDAGECYVNPVDAQVEINAVPSSTLEFDYDYFDYPSGIDVMADTVGDEIDVLHPLTEKGSVVDDANVEVATLKQEYNLVLAVGGADIHIPDVNNFTQSYDDSRTQVVYPTRFEDGTSAVAAVVAHKCNLGLAETPINKRLTTNKRLHDTQVVNRAERGTLGDEGVACLADESRGVRITDDPTTVSDSNTDEKNLNYAFSRLAADYIIETTYDNQQPFIGKLNSETVRQVLEGMVTDSLQELQNSNVVLSYSVNITKEDAVTAGLEMQVDLIEPLRFIDNELTVGSSA